MPSGHVLNDVAFLLDRLMVLFERPAHISEGHDLSVRSELSIDALSSSWS